MTTAKKPESFASHNLDHLKVLIAREIRKQISENNMKYIVATEIFGLSGAAVSRIVNCKELSMSFETLHNAAVTSGMIVSMQLSVPN